MSVRRAVVEADVATLNVAEFCRDHGISRWFFYDLRRRHAAEGETALEVKSRAPRRVANRTSADVEDRIVRIRKELASDGFDAGPASIFDALGDDAPSESTIWRVLDRRGLIIKTPAKAPKRSRRRFVADRANERWQIDATHWSLADGTAVEIINVLDDCTRVAVASRVVPACTIAAAFDALTWGAARWGWPEGILSDNGSAFRGGPSPQLGGLAALLVELGVRADRSRPHHPQTCGKVERFHQTLKQHLAAHSRSASITALQDRIDTFIERYNTQRPHRALGRQRPADVWHAAPRSGPASHALNAATTIHHAIVTRGVIQIGRRFEITVGATWNNHTATTIITGLNAHVFINGHLARRLTINPSRRCQPLHQDRNDP